MENNQDNILILDELFKTYDDNKLILSKLTEELNWSTKEIVFNLMLLNKDDIIVNIIENETIDIKRSTILGVASFCGNMKIVELLLERYIVDYNKVLIHACRGGSFDMVRYALRYKVDLNLALVEATRNDIPSILKLLIEEGANSYKCALEHAEYYQSEKCIKLLQCYCK